MTMVPKDSIVSAAQAGQVVVPYVVRGKAPRQAASAHRLIMGRNRALGAVPSHPLGHWAASSSLHPGVRSVPNQNRIDEQRLYRVAFLTDR